MRGVAAYRNTGTHPARVPRYLVKQTDCTQQERRTEIPGRTLHGCRVTWLSKRIALSKSAAPSRFMQPCPRALCL